MWVKQCHCAPSPSHHHFYRWYKLTIPKWVVYGIVLHTLHPIIVIRMGRMMRRNTWMFGYFETNPPESDEALIRVAIYSA